MLLMRFAFVHLLVTKRAMCRAQYPSVADQRTTAAPRLLFVRFDTVTDQRLTRKTTKYFKTLVTNRQKPSLENIFLAFTIGRHNVHACQSLCLISIDFVRVVKADSTLRHGVW